MAFGNRLINTGGGGGGPAVVGDLRDGGVVVWVDPLDDTRGIVMDINVKQPGFWMNTNPRYLVGASGTAIGTGYSNTVTAVNAAGTGVPLLYAAFNHDGGGYDDWFLPSLDEFEQILIVRDTINPVINANGGIPIEGNSVYEKYWTSSETSAAGAWNWNTQNSVKYQYDGKDQYYRGRFCRYFGGYPE